MYTQQFIKSVKKVFLWYLYGRLREQIFKKFTILDKNTFIKIRHIWKHTPPSVNLLTAVTEDFSPYQKIGLPTPALMENCV